MSSDPHRILSIQSHVASGYVGNRAATFPLQTLGYDVDVINTVNFSNHTGYKVFKGQKTSADVLAALLDGLKTNGIDNHAKILTGYVPSAESLEVIETHVRTVLDARSETIYILDPVMGDIDRGLYVSPDVVPVYTRMLKLATIITPNQFEVELLADTKITDLATLHTALHRLHTQYSLPHIVISSIPLSSAVIRDLAVCAPPTAYTDLLPTPLPSSYHELGTETPDDKSLVCFASSWTERDGMRTWAFGLPTIDIPFTGTGDLLSALCAAYFDPLNSSSPLADAVSKALLTVQQILLKTHLHALSVPAPPGSETVATARTLRERELRLIPERALIASPGEGWVPKTIDWSTLM